MIIVVNLDPTVGHEIKKSRPCLVVQNDIGNANSAVTIVVPIEGAEHIKKLYRVHVLIPQGEAGLIKNSVALCNQVRAVDERRFVKTLGMVRDTTMQAVDQALRVSLAL